jgi:hypothetical protein
VVDVVVIPDDPRQAVPCLDVERHTAMITVPSR